MARASIDYMNARRELKHATSGGKTYSRECEYAPDCELDLTERTELECESAWSDFRIYFEAYWQRMFERFGMLPSEPVDEIPF